MCGKKKMKTELDTLILLKMIVILHQVKTWNQVFIYYYVHFFFKVLVWNSYIDNSLPNLYFVLAANF